MSDSAHMRDEDLDEYRYLWDGTEPDWVLVARDSGGFGIYNRRTRAALIIEDDDTAKHVRERMLREKVPVLDRIPAGDFVPGVSR